MNERIKELAKQAGVYFGEAHKDYFGEEHPAYVSIRDMDFEKFAELIVKECMAMCKTSVGNADYNTGRLHCLNNIKEHFGVEE